MLQRYVKLAGMEVQITERTKLRSVIKPLARSWGHTYRNAFKSKKERITTEFKFKILWL